MEELLVLTRLMVFLVDGGFFKPFNETEQRYEVTGDNGRVYMLLVLRKDKGVMIFEKRMGCWEKAFGYIKQVFHRRKVPYVWIDEVNYSRYNGIDFPTPVLEDVVAKFTTSTFEPILKGNS